jgi:hypothetical protein
MPYAIRPCSTCSLDFQPSSRHSKCPKCRAKDRRVPCQKCGELKQYTSAACKNCYSQKLDENGNWKGGRIVHKAGYLMVKVPGWKKNNGYKFEHTIVMEEYLGRELLPGENVHHKNGVRDDNSIENLELWVKPQPTGIRVEDAIKWATEIIERYKDFSGPGGN